jgi:prolyl-tRNA editing enzyme YbaK/EbsC (Cys-tRNA(Pro) deacylase)
MENLLNKEPVKRVQEFIAQFDPKLKVLSLNTTARTAKDAAESLGCEAGAIVKSLVFRADDTFLICLVAGDKRCSLNKLKKVISKKDVCMANAEEVKTNTGFSIGGVAPIAHLKKLNNSCLCFALCLLYFCSISFKKSLTKALSICCIL